jgi:hypothetical protein
LHEALAWHWILHAAALSMFEGVAIGLAFPVGPVGVAPQVSRTASLCPLFLLVGLVEPVPDRVLGLEPVLEPVFEPVLGPVGFEAVGMTVGTKVQVLPYATRLVLA